jgi:hypothetical protein
MMLMSNPGLHLALLGNPPRRKRRSHSRTRRNCGNPRSRRRASVRRHHHHRNPRRNPVGVVHQYVSAVKAGPREVLGIFKGRNKIKNIAFALGGAVATYAIGGIANTSVLTPALNAVGAGAALNNPMAKRVIGAAVPFTLGFAANKLIKGEIGKAMLVGGVIASIAEAVSPGLIARLAYKVPQVGPVAVAAAPAAAVTGPVNGMNGLGGYVDARAYNGTGEELAGYVDARAYNGTGEELAGYVDARAYNGTGGLGDDEDDLAGVGDYLTASSKYLDTYLN